MTLSIPLAAAKAAWLEVEAAAEEKARHTKQQRVEEPPAPAPAEPAWRKRPYAAYTSVDQWKKEEGANWNRRRVPLCGKPGRPASKLPRPSRHDERGVPIGYLNLQFCQKSLNFSFNFVKNRFAGALPPLPRPLAAAG